MSDSLQPHESQHARPPCLSSLKLTSIELVMPSSHLILCRPFSSCPQSSQHQSLFQRVNSLHEVAKYWSLSFSINPSKEHPGLINQNGLVGSPCSPRDSQESSSTTQFKSINSSALSFLHSPTLTSIHDHRKNHSLD